MEERKKTRENPAIRLRPPEQKDSLALMDFFNGLMEEGLQLNYDRKVGYEEEGEWLRKKLEEVVRSEAILLVAEQEDGKIVGAADVRRGRFKEAHTAELGVSVGRDYRKRGLGTRMIRIALKEAERLGIKLVWLQVFSTNVGAIELYKRLGFRKEALLKKRLLHGGKYVDKIIMSRPLRR